MAFHPFHQIWNEQETKTEIPEKWKQRTYEKKQQINKNNLNNSYDTERCK